MFAVLSFWSDEGLMLKTSIHCFTISYIDLRIKNSSRIYMEDNVACKHGLQKCIMPPSPHPHAQDALCENTTEQKVHKFFLQSYHTAKSDSSTNMYYSHR